MHSSLRYSKQQSLPGIGAPGQSKLAKAKVLIVGAGGLGNIIVPFLAGAGVGIIGIIDADSVHLSNLHRQVFYSEQDINHKKVEVLAERARVLNSEIDIREYDMFLDARNAQGIIHDYDLVIDATDNIPVRYIINDACLACDKPFIHGAIYKWQYQISVFNYKGGGTYRCLYPTPAISGKSCSETGVLGPVVGMAGLAQATEAIKIITDTGNILSDKLLIVDLFRNNQYTLQYSRKNEAAFNQSDEEEEDRVIHYLQSKPSADSLLVDVREFHELPSLDHDRIARLPLSQLISSLPEWDASVPYYLFCQNGVRSRKAKKILDEAGFTLVNCLNLNAKQIGQILIKQHAGKKA